MEKTRSADSLQKRWNALWNDLGADGNASVVFAELSRLHSGRPYHNLDHVESCLKELDDAKERVEDPKAVAFALWFHDAIYDSRQNDNEERSAELAASVARTAELGEVFAQRVRMLVLVTKHTGLLLDNDSRYVADMDLTILGQPEEVFDAYDRNVRKEYLWVPEEAYRKGRSSVLKSFLDREFVYSTEFFRAKYEEPARENLIRALRRTSQ